MGIPSGGAPVTKELTHDSSGSYSNRLLHVLFGVMFIALLTKYGHISFEETLFVVLSNLIFVIFLKVCFNK